MRVLAVVLLILALSASQAPGRTWHVPSEAPTIQAGVDSAAYGDTVVVTCGTYYEQGIIVGNGITVQSETLNPDCVSIDATENDRVFRGNGITLIGLTIRGGRKQDSGGGVYGSGRIEHCVFENNRADAGKELSKGGAVGGSFTVESSTFRNNGASGYGGALSGASTVTDCIFIGNSSSTEWGGAVYNGGPYRGCYFEGNRGHSGAHAVYFKRHSGLLEDCVFTGNRSYNGVVRGFGSSPTIRRCTFYNNTVTHSSDCSIDMVAEIGGSIPHPVIEHCTIYGDGVAIEANGQSTGITVSVLNTLISDCLDAFLRLSDSSFTIDCCVAWNTDLKDRESDQQRDIIEADPLFCNPEEADFTLDAESPCLPSNSGTCGLIGAWDQGCGVVPVEKSSWGKLKGQYSDN